MYSIKSTCACAYTGARRDKVSQSGRVRRKEKVQNIKHSLIFRTQLVRGDGIIIFDFWEFYPSTFAFPPWGRKRPAAYCQYICNTLGRNCQHTCNMSSIYIQHNTQ